MRQFGSLPVSVVWLQIFTKATLCSRAIEHLRDCEMEQTDAKPNLIALCELIVSEVRLRHSVSAPFCNQGSRPSALLFCF